VVSNDGDPITLADACESVFGGKIKPATLRAVAQRGNLMIFRIGRRDFTTPALVRDMVKKKCIPSRPLGDEDRNQLPEALRAAAARVALDQTLVALKRRSLKPANLAPCSLPRDGGTFSSAISLLASVIVTHTARFLWACFLRDGAPAVAGAHDQLRAPWPRTRAIDPRSPSDPPRRSATRLAVATIDNGAPTLRRCNPSITSIFGRQIATHPGRSARHFCSHLRPLY
jgi:hypothetical protein